MNQKCRICGNNSFKQIYKGEIRSAGVGSKFISGYSVWECSKCKIHFLNPFPANLSEFYESEEYRQHYDKTVDPNQLAAKYDVEQNNRVKLVGIENIREKKILDIGCGAGLFLDVCHNIAAETNGVEVMAFCKEVLEQKGHRYFKNLDDIEEKSMDMAVSFDTLEHIENPNKFLKGIFRSLKKGGTFLICIPNRNDIQLKINKKVFEKFFYCKAHLYYYDLKCLSDLLRNNGFQIQDKGSMHKYDFYNLISWLSKREPCGRKKLDGFDRHFEETLYNEISRLNMGSHIWVKSTVAK